jgi:hypothetical protein
VVASSAGVKWDEFQIEPLPILSSSVLGRPLDSYAKGRGALKKRKPPSKAVRARQRLQQKERDAAAIIAESVRESTTASERYCVARKTRLDEAMQSTVNLDKARYLRYIMSEEWRVFHLGIIARRGSRCEVCGKQLSIPQAHHLTYERIGRERDSDVVMTCDDCHRRYHGKPSIAKMRLKFLADKSTNSS